MNYPSIFDPLFQHLCIMLLGTLYLIPVPLASNVGAASFTPYLSQVVNQLNEYIVENEKTARRFLKEAGLTTPQNELIVHDYGKHVRNTTSMNDYFSGLVVGNDVGLMSEAGCPGIADPGAEIIAEAHKRGIKVVPLVGPSSIILALMASGFNGQSFTFHGYLPIDKIARHNAIKLLEKVAQEKKQTQLFIETPFRNNHLLEDILKTCNEHTKLCVACNVTAVDELIISESIGQWRRRKLNLHKKPAIFLIY